MPALAAVAIVAASALPGQAATTQSDLGVTARFDRRVVLADQIAVAEVTVGNRGPDASGVAALAVTASGGTIIRTHARGGRCGAPDNGRRVRCTLPVTAFGTVATVTLHIRARAAATAVRVDALVRSGNDPAAANDRGASRVAVSPTARDAAELSFVFEAPATVRVRRPFGAVLRVLNRGPAEAAVIRVALTTSPGDARVQLSRLPQRLASGAERTVTAQITPLRPGRLTLDLRIGRTGRARLAVVVQGAPAEE